jgi:hypothetical protein
MRTTIAILVLALLSAAAFTQDKPVAITDESHHHLVLENEYTRVFHVQVPSKQSTLMHQHDLDYVFVQIGATDFTNDRVGAAPAEVKLADGTVKFAKGGFAHKITILSDAPFENLTIEVKKPSTKSICGANWPGVQPEKPDACGAMSENGGFAHTTLFDTDAVEAHIYAVTGNGTGVTSVKDDNPRLFVALTPLHCSCGGPKPLDMKPGDIAWLTKGTPAEVSKSSDPVPRFVSVSFK